MTDVRDGDEFGPATAGARDDRSDAPGGPGMGAPGAGKAKPREGFAGTPRLPRIQLDSLVRVRREIAQLYAEAKHGRRDVQDASRLANILALIARLLEGGELERRLEELEKLAAEARGRP